MTSFISSLSLARIGAAAFGGGAVVGGIVTNMWNSRGEPTKERVAESVTAGHIPISVSGHSALSKYGHPEKLVQSGPICYTNHCLEFDAQRRTPVWVAEHLSKEKVSPTENPANRKHSKFRPDPSLPVEARTSNDDFWDSGWSRGHMAPAGNNKHCQKSMNDTFLLSNIVPQDIDNNGNSFQQLSITVQHSSDFWNRLEIYCRDLTKQFSDVWVISGPLWIPKEVEKGKDGPGTDVKKQRKRNKVMKYEVIGQNHVSVPTHLYKIVLAEDQTASPKQQPLLAAFVVPNKPIERSKTLLDFRIPLPDLERYLGYRFFNRLNREEAQDLCQVEGCKITGYREFQSYFITRGINGARNEKELNRYWKKAVDLDLVSPELMELRERKMAGLLEKSGGNSTNKRAATAG